VPTERRVDLAAILLAPENARPQGNHEPDKEVNGVNDTTRKTMAAVLAVAGLTTVVWWGGASYVASQRDRLVARLAERLQSASEAEALAALGQLAQLDDAAVKPLLAAATAPRRPIAIAARAAIDQMLARWHDDAQTAGNHTRFAERLDRLAATLASRPPGQNNDQMLWAHDLAERILNAAGQIPAGQRLEIVRNCDQLVRHTGQLVTAPNTAPAAAPAPQVTTLNGPNASSSPANARLAALPQQTPLAPPFESLRTTPLPPVNENRGLANARFAAVNGERDAETQSQLAARRSDPSITWSPDRVEPNGMSGDSNRLLPWTGLDQSPPPGESDRPRFFDAELTSSGPQGPASPDDPPLRPNSTPHQLLNQLANSSAENVNHVQRQMAERGLGIVPPTLARRLLSKSPAERVQAVDALLETSGTAPGPWLMVMADDPAAEVRLAVVTLMATSKSPQLVEKAWQVALNDEDPRLADLAEWLQTQRNALRRR
jgi:hypothetical protein